MRASQDYRLGFVVADGGAQLDPPLSVAGAVVFSCLKGAEDGNGLILRCFNPGDSTEIVRITGNVTV